MDEILRAYDDARADLLRKEGDLDALWRAVVAADTLFDAIWQRRHTATEKVAKEST